MVLAASQQMGPTSLGGVGPAYVGGQGRSFGQSEFLTPGLSTSIPVRGQMFAPIGNGAHPGEIELVHATVSAGLQPGGEYYYDICRLTPTDQVCFNMLLKHHNPTGTFLNHSNHIRPQVAGTGTSTVASVSDSAPHDCAGILDGPFHHWRDI